MSFYKTISILLLNLSLIGCQGGSKADLKIGTIAGPETDLVKVAQNIAEKNYGLNIKIIEFNDYQLPNEALADGSLDMNIYQHLPFLNASRKARGYSLAAIGKTFVYPMGIYSKRYPQLNRLPAHAMIAIPNDPSNQTRALMLLQAAGLIHCLDKDILSLKDIDSNPLNLKLKEMDAAQLPRLLTDLDAAVINTTYAIPAGLKPDIDAIFLESKDSPYANLMVVKQKDIESEKLKQFVLAMHDPAVLAKAQELFGSAAIQAWNN